MEEVESREAESQSWNSRDASRNESCGHGVIGKLTHYSHAGAINSSPFYVQLPLGLVVLVSYLRVQALLAGWQCTHAVSSQEVPIAPGASCAPLTLKRG